MGFYDLRTFEFSAAWVAIVLSRLSLRPVGSVSPTLELAVCIIGGLGGLLNSLRIAYDL